MFVEKHQNPYVMEFEEIIEDGKVVKYHQMYWGEVDHEYAERVIRNARRRHNVHKEHEVKRTQGIGRH